MFTIIIDFGDKVVAETHNSREYIADLQSMYESAGIPVTVDFKENDEGTS